MGRTAKHNWSKLFLEFCQGKYKSIAEFSRKRKLNPNQVRDEFRKLNGSRSKLVEEALPATEKQQKKQQKTTEKKRRSTEKKGRTTEKKHTAWDAMRKQFTDWPDEKRQAYLIQLEQRLAELNAVDYEELSAEEKKELGDLRRDRRAILSDPDPDRQCAAHRRDGQPCGNPAERGKSVCWVHGGAPGTGAPTGNKNGLRHGLYAKILPDCEEFREMVRDIEQTTPLEKIEQSITLLQAQISWAQRIMFVKSQDDIVKHLKRVKDGDKFSEEEWEFQYPWDRQAAFLAALAKSTTSLEKLIARYEAMATEEQKTKVAKLKADIARIAGGDEGATEDDGFIEALKTEAAEVWGDEEN